VIIRSAYSKDSSLTITPNDPDNIRVAGVLGSRILGEYKFMRKYEGMSAKEARTIIWRIVFFAHLMDNDVTYSFNMKSYNDL
jgi:hypothetical protein